MQLFFPEMKIMAKIRSTPEKLFSFEQEMENRITKEDCRERERERVEEGLPSLEGAGAGFWAFAEGTARPKTSTNAAKMKRRLDLGMITISGREIREELLLARVPTYLPRSSSPMPCSVLALFRLRCLNKSRSSGVPRILEKRKPPISLE